MPEASGARTHHSVARWSRAHPDDGPDQTTPVPSEPTRTASVAGPGGLRDRSPDRVVEAGCPGPGTGEDVWRLLDGLVGLRILDVGAGTRVDGFPQSLVRLAVAEDVDVDAGRLRLVEAFRVEADGGARQLLVVAAGVTRNDVVDVDAALDEVGGDSLEVGRSRGRRGLDEGAAASEKDRSQEDGTEQGEPVEGRTTGDHAVEASTTARGRPTAGQLPRARRFASRRRASVSPESAVSGAGAGWGRAGAGGAGSGTADGVCPDDDGFGRGGAAFGAAVVAGCGGAMGDDAPAGASTTAAAAAVSPRRIAARAEDPAARSRAASIPDTSAGRGATR